MAVAIVAAVAALVSALAGVFLQSLIGDRKARSERRRREFVEAVREVLRTFVEFRAQQYLKIEDRAQGESDTRETRSARYAARSAFATAIDQLHTATTDQRLLDAVEEARLLAIALGDAAPEPGVVDEQAVARIGDQLRQTHTALRDTARCALRH